MRKSEVLEERRLVFGCVVVFWLCGGFMAGSGFGPGNVAFGPPGRKKRSLVGRRKKTLAY